MRSEINRRKLFSRRAFVIGGGKLVLLSSLVARLYYLQFTRGSEYITLSENNRVKLQLLTPERGIITDRFGEPMAVNEDNFRVMLDTEQFKRLEQMVGKVAQLLDKDPAEMLPSLRKKLQKQRHQPLMLIDQLSWEDVSRIEVHSPELPGVDIDVGKLRHYPYAEETAHVLGYVGDVSEDNPNARQLARLPELKVGRKGIEKVYEERLRGQPGTRHAEVNSVGMTVRELAREESRQGERLPVSIDIRLQKLMHERLAQERSASAVILNARTGEILALTSHPSYDPNRFNRGITHDYWNELNGNPLTPLLNKAIAGQYPPGSTFKMLVGLAGLESGDIQHSTRFLCPGHMKVGNHTFHCWKREGHGFMNIEEAIEQSCDVYFYNVSLKIGIEKIADMARRFGLGERTGLSIAGEQPGLIPDKEWKRYRYGQPWQKGDSVNASIGQGYVLATPIQLAIMAARLGNGGVAVTPTFDRIDKGNVPEFPKMDVNPEHLRMVQRGMERVTTSVRGTAYWHRIQDESLAMAGKTGTSQVKRLSKTVKNEDEEWRFKHHALFVAYAPIQEPEYACAVVVEHGGSGSASAAPIASQLLESCQQLLHPFSPMSKPKPAPEVE